MTVFDEGLQFILRPDVEGGYYDGSDPRDPNPTNMGVTQKTFDRYRAALKPKLRPVPVRKITKDEVASIYQIMYWTKGKCAEIAKRSDVIAIIHFDACVNHGIASPNNDKSAGAIELLQRTVGVKDDGIWGPITQQALWSELAAPGEIKLGKRYLSVREAQYRHLAEHAPHTLGLNLKNWLSRLKKLSDHLGIT